jgi:DNA-directed RNA polymerase specialized sigma24 family protein
LPLTLINQIFTSDYARPNEGGELIEPGDQAERRATSRRRSAGEPIEPVAESDEHAVVCACLDAAVDTLKPEHAEVLRRVDLGGEDPEAVATALGITAVNLKVRRHRARETLRERLVSACRTCGTHGCRDCDCAG